MVIHYDPPDDHKNYPTARAAPPAPASRAWSSPSCSGTRSCEVRDMQRRLGLDHPIVEMFSNDPRLADLATWDPAAVAA